MAEEVATHPVQVRRRLEGKGAAPQTVTMRAYEVYCHTSGPQEALVTGGCRGGFGVGELIAFLYARSFPENEWGKRFREACRGLDVD